MKKKLVFASCCIALGAMLLLGATNGLWAAGPITKWSETIYGEDSGYTVVWTWIIVGIYPSNTEATEAAQNDSVSPWHYFGVSTNYVDGYRFAANYILEYEGTYKFVFFRRYLWPPDGIMPEQTTPNYSDLVNESRGN